MVLNGPWYHLISCFLLSAEFSWFLHLFLPSSSPPSFLAFTTAYLPVVLGGIKQLFYNNTKKHSELVILLLMMCVFGLQRYTARRDLLWPGRGEGLHEGQCRSVREEDQVLPADLQPEWKHVHALCLWLPGLTHCTVCVSFWLLFINLL